VVHENWMSFENCFVKAFYTDARCLYPGTLATALHLRSVLYFHLFYVYNSQ